MAKRRRKKGFGWGKFILFLVFLAAAGVVGYMYYSGYQSWQGKFLPNTYINGVNYGGLTPEEAKALYDRNCEGFALTIHEMNEETETIPYSEFGYELTMSRSFRELCDAQDYRLWPIATFEDKVITTEQGYRYDEVLLAENVLAIHALTSPEIQDPVDAKVVKTDDGYVISPHDDGNRLKEDEVLALALDALATGGKAPTEIDLVGNDCYLKAEIRTEDDSIQKKFAKLDKVQTTSIDIFLEEAYETLDKSIFLDWMGYSKKKVTIDRDEVAAYVDELAAEYNTLRKERTFHTMGGDEITVGGDDMDSYGYVMDREATTEALYNALLAGESKTVNAVFEEYALCRYSENDDIGDTYIEISIDEQHMWYVVDGEVVVETDVVTGLPTLERETPCGVFAVLEKLKDHTMNGSYGSAFTKYTLSFNWDGICIHDASWRDSYGGQIYLNDGSHGCVNTPLDKVEEIFNLVHINTPIVIY